MISSKITLTTTEFSIPQSTPNPAFSPAFDLSHCTLKWRRHQLWVSPSLAAQPLPLASLQNQAATINCLKQSAVKLVVLDPALGAESVKLWLHVCAAARKQAVVRVPVLRQKLNKGDRFLPWLKQLPERLSSALILIIFSPLILGIRLFLQIAALLSSTRWQRALSGSR